MSFTKDALEHVEQNAFAATLDAKTLCDFNVAVLPGGMQIHDLEEYQEHRNQFRGALSTNSIKDFVEYSNLQAKGSCFISRSSMSAQTVFDLGDDVNPGHCKHTAKVSLKKLAAYSQLQNQDGRRMDQQDFAEFIEDYRDNIKLVADFPYDLEDFKVMDFSEGIAAIRRVTINKKREQEHGVQSFSANKSSMEQIDATSDGNQLPGYLTFQCKPYESLSQYTFVVRIGLVITGNEPVFIPRIIKAEETEELMSDEFTDLITGDLDDTIPHYMGMFDSK